jgi:hypothetical protein
MQLNRLRLFLAYQRALMLCDKQSFIPHDQNKMFPFAMNAALSTFIVYGLNQADEKIFYNNFFKDIL